jgi:hypothetical protein
VFRQKLLGEDGIVRWGVVMVKQPDLLAKVHENESNESRADKYGQRDGRTFKNKPVRAFRDLRGRT